MIRKLRKNIYEVGTRDWDRTLFDNLIPLPAGTSYNSYLIIGSEKTALIDTVDPTKKNELISNLKKLNIKKLDYIVSNHAEQDHSGSIPYILEMYPESKVVTNEKCKGFLYEHLLINDDRFIIINDNETLSLGDKTLQFLITPWVHWPETMLTYLVEDKILFTCDFFGSHKASSSLFVSEEKETYFDAKRYYAEIMMPFRTIIKKHIERVESLEVDYIAPSHGEIYNNPEFIINTYKKWISNDVENFVIIPYVSMHDSTEEMVKYLVDRLVDKGIKVKPFNLINSDLGEIAITLVDAATIVVGAPAILVGTHPAIISAVYLVNALRPKTKFASIIGSYSWGTKLIDHITSLITNIKPEIIDPVLIKGYPKSDDFKAIDKLADEIEKRHKTINLM